MPNRLTKQRSKGLKKLNSAKTKLTKIKNARAGQIYVPAGVMSDSMFPFNVPATVQIKIDGARLVVEA